MLRPFSSSRAKSEGQSKFCVQLKTRSAKSIMKKAFISLFFLHIALFAKAQLLDLILTNGKIFTSDTTQLYVEALAINAGRITASGTTGAIEKLATKNTKHINLKGMLVATRCNDA